MPKGDIGHPKTVIVATPEAMAIYELQSDDDQMPEGLEVILSELMTIKGEPTKTGKQSWRLRSLVGPSYNSVLKYMHKNGMVEAKDR